MARSRVLTRRSFARPIVWAALTVLIAAVVVQTTRSGIDILALLVAGFVLLLLERTLGDWVAETLGPVPTTLIFAAVAALGVAYVTTDSGRGRARRLFAAADAQGYHTVYFSLEEASHGTSPGVTDALSDALAQPVNARPLVATSGTRSAATATTPTSTSPAPTSGHVAASRGETSSTGDAASTRAAVSTNAAPSGASGGPAGGVRIARLTVSPEIGIVGEALAFRVAVSSDSAGILPDVEFSVDGRSLATVRPDVDGIATAHWKTMVPGQYVVRARLSGGYLGGLSASTTLNVMAGKR